MAIINVWQWWFSW